MTFELKLLKRKVRFGMFLNSIDQAKIDHEIINSNEKTNKSRVRPINRALTLEHTDKNEASNSNAKLSIKAHNEPLLENDFGPE